jgi:hypothetical protein
MQRAKMASVKTCTVSQPGPAAAHTRVRCVNTTRQTSHVTHAVIPVQHQHAQHGAIRQLDLHIWPAAVASELTGLPDSSFFFDNFFWRVPLLDPLANMEADRPLPGEPWNEQLVKSLNARYIQAHRKVRNIPRGVHNLNCMLVQSSMYVQLCTVHSFPRTAGTDAHTASHPQLSVQTC